MQPESLDSLIVSARDFDSYNGHKRLHTFELPQSSTDTTTKTIHPTATAQELARWLGQPNIAGRDCSARASMKILLIQTRNQSTAKKSPTLVHPSGAMLQGPLKTQRSEQGSQADYVLNILEGLDLPPAAFGSYIKAYLTFVCVPPNVRGRGGQSKDGGSRPSSPSTRYYCSGTSWTVTWAYNHASRHTATVIFHREGDGDDRVAEVLSDLVRLQSHLAHPMLLGYVKTKISLTFTFDMLDGMNRETLALEREIGFPTWNWVLDRVESGKGVSDTQDAAVEGFNALAGKLTNIRFRLRTFQQQIKFISRCNNNYRRILRKSPPSTTSMDDALLECDELDGFMDVIWDYTFVHLFDADSLGERLHDAMSSVFQLTTQRDSRASLAIADINNELSWQGKNTNTSMMTIAFVSLLFLPGTFVASFFDAPIFDFSASGPAGSGLDHGVVVAEPFWIYWTVTGLLTLTLCLGWMRYLRRRRALDLRDRENELRQFRDRIQRRRGGSSVSSESTVVADQGSMLQRICQFRGPADPAIEGKAQRHGPSDVEACWEKEPVILHTPPLARQGRLEAIRTTLSKPVALPSWFGTRPRRELCSLRFIPERNLYGIAVGESPAPSSGPLALPSKIQSGNETGIGYPGAFYPSPGTASLAVLAQSITTEPTGTLGVLAAAATAARCSSGLAAILAGRVGIDLAVSKFTGAHALVRLSIFAEAIVFCAIVRLDLKHGRREKQAVGH